ncbi:MAG: hypothetical protein KIT54_04390 [Phycisphaeraceae bacterium]|nr:hypothetical protein [Phycisphaeraceae bacterium]
MRLHRPPDPTDKLGCSGCLQVVLLAAAVMGVGSVVVFLVAGVVGRRGPRPGPPGEPGRRKPWKGLGLAGGIGGAREGGLRPPQRASHRTPAARAANDPSQRKRAFGPIAGCGRCSNARGSGGGRGFSNNSQSNWRIHQ